MKIKSLRRKIAVLYIVFFIDAILFLFFWGLCGSTGPAPAPCELRSFSPIGVIIILAGDLLVYSIKILSERNQNYY